MSDLLLRALRGEPVERLPVWMMRQAGRVLPEYRALRARHDFLTLCRTPELAAEVTLQPVQALGVDGAILFSDILVPLLPSVPGLDFAPGPKFEAPIRTPDGLGDPEDVSGVGYVAETIRILRRSLPVPLLGFGGAPFTLATYLAEGGTAKSFTAFRRLLHQDSGAATELLSWLERRTVAYLRMQVEAGAQAIQIFDTWGGELSPADFEAYSAPGLRRICLALRKTGVPVIYFARGTLRDVGADVTGVDWTQDLAAARRTGPVQGNLDPAGLFAAPAEVAGAVRRMAAPVAGPGYVVNLGHGLLPETPLESVRAFVRAAQEVPLS